MSRTKFKIRYYSIYNFKGNILPVLPTHILMR